MARSPEKSKSAKRIAEQTALCLRDKQHWSALVHEDLVLRRATP
jgi:hypothetical protein